MLQKIKWTYARLRSMSPVEILHRVREQARRRADRKRTPTILPETLPTWPEKPKLRSRLLTTMQSPEVASRAQATFQHVRDRQFAYLGRAWPETETLEACWFRDPVSGQDWDSSSYCFSIDFRHQTGLGDVKYVAELNRLQFLQPIACLAAARDHEEMTTLCRDAILSWLASNRSFHGIHWSSMIELALRATSISLAALALGPMAFSEDEQRLMQQSMVDHADWMLRYPSLHSSANNHYIAELAGLYMIGTLWPGLPRAALYRDTGKAGLEAEALRQIYPDGVGVEQSISYTALTLDWFLLCAAIAEETDAPFSDAFHDRIRRSGAYLRAMLDDGNHHPAIGDDDDSSVMRGGFGQEPVVASVLSAIAAKEERGELAPARPVRHLRNALFGPAPAAFGAMSGVRHFPDGGYTAVHDKLGGRSTMLLFDHGPLGYLSIAAHGHADVLSLCLHLDGKPVLIDPNTGLYHGGGAWRDLFRATRMHNTLSIAGEDSSIMTGPFNWGARASVSEVAVRDETRDWHMKARHDGFVARHGVLHQREIVRDSDDTFRVTDQLITAKAGAGEARDVSLSFMLAADLACEAGQDDHSFLLRRGGANILEVTFDPRLTATCEACNYSPAFGQIGETRRLFVQGQMPPDTSSETRFRVIP